MQTMPYMNVSYQDTVHTHESEGFSDTGQDVGCIRQVTVLIHKGEWMLCYCVVGRISSYMCVGCGVSHPSLSLLYPSHSGMSHASTTTLWLIGSASGVHRVGTCRGTRQQHSPSRSEWDNACLTQPHSIKRTQPS